MKCHKCKASLQDTPMCFGANSPAELFVTEAEYNQKVVENEDVCIIDNKYFFVRGHISIPVTDTNETFAWSVWVSLSQDSFNHMLDNWENKTREINKPYFGWLTTNLHCYPDTQNLKTSVQTMPIGQVPRIVLEKSSHPLSIEQHQGITKSRVYEIAHMLLHQ